MRSEKPRPQARGRQQVRTGIVRQRRRWTRPSSSSTATAWCMHPRYHRSTSEADPRTSPRPRRERTQAGEGDPRRASRRPAAYSKTKCFRLVREVLAKARIPGADAAGQRRLARSPGVSRHDPDAEPASEVADNTGAKKIVQCIKVLGVDRPASLRHHRRTSWWGRSREALPGGSVKQGDVVKGSHRPYRSARCGAVATAATSGSTTTPIVLLDGSERAASAPASSVAVARELREQELHEASSSLASEVV